MNKADLYIEKYIGVILVLLVLKDNRRLAKIFEYHHNTQKLSINEILQGHIVRPWVKFDHKNKYCDDN